MILCIGATPALQRVMIFKRLQIGSVNRAVETLDGAAGKSINVAKVLKALGATPVAAGFVGGDRGEELSRVMEARGIECDFITVPGRTRQCTTVIDEAAGEQTELVEESRPVSRASYRALLRIVERRVHQSNAMVMSGTLTPGAPEDFYFRCAKLGRAAGALVIVDAKSEPLFEALKAKPDLVKPNRSELETTLRTTITNESHLRAAMREIYRRGAMNIVVTDGNKATMAFDGRRFYKVASPRIKAVNPIGSGDAFTAGLAWQLSRGSSLAEACRWAAACGAANALTAMPGELNAKETLRLVRKTRVARVALGGYET